MKRYTAFRLLLLTSLIVGGCSDKSESGKAQAVVSPDEAKSIAKEAYIYGFPMVMNYKTMWNCPMPRDSQAPIVIEAGIPSAVIL